MRLLLGVIGPRVAGLGRSPTAQAQAYAHPVLGPRLRACCQALLGLEKTGAAVVLGAVDAQRLRSSMTLFAGAVPRELLLAQVLGRVYDGQQLTLALLRAAPADRP